VNQPRGVGDIFGEDIPPLRGTPACDGVDPKLFDSVHEEDHITVAVEYCAGCPAKRSCLERREWLANLHPYAKPEGTWGGRLYNTKGRQKRVKPNKYIRYRAA